MSNRRIHVDYIARAEGDGAFDIVIDNEGVLKKASWQVWEPPRFFEAFMVGRKAEEVPELVQRICGICPHSHHISALRAVERAMDVTVSEQTVLLRELLHYSDWIMSHALHVYYLAAPDFLGYESVIAMTENPDLLPIVKEALKLKRLGNDMIVCLSGQEIQNKTSVIGGFTSLPTLSDLNKMKEQLKKMKDFAYSTVGLANQLASQVPYKDLSRKCEHVALSDPDKYAINDGRFVSTEGLDIGDWEYPQWIMESHIPGCNAKHSVIKGRDSFLTGPLARVNVNFNKLSKDAGKAAGEVGFNPPSFNPFMSIVARAIELVHAIDTSTELIDAIGKPVEEEPKFSYKAGESYAITEAPRGICCHGGKIDKYGVVQKWDIVAPTARNIYNLEKDFREFIPKLLHLSDEELTLKCEVMIRNYDPCQSCATHSLKIRLRREGN
ncbi:MAG: Ni/Fe hydrogenase subunit alpha [Peptococcaceae bacterium]|nr:Ni/Fe hydrogenase subunit alpha [Peptococcaceae bacterium]